MKIGRNNLIIHGDCLEEMQKFADNSIDFIVTDPPYGISFMGKKWDRQIPSIEYWKEMLRICKPGSYIAAAGLPRMIHRITCVIEDAGWTIRDMIIHLFGSGFPKSHNNFGLDGYGTALKPAWEGWILAIKPLNGTYAQNVEKWGLGGINIEESRIPGNKPDTIRGAGGQNGRYGPINSQGKIEDDGKGRWPANLILDEEAAEMLDQQTGILQSGIPGIRRKEHKTHAMSGILNLTGKTESGMGDSGGASRFFYCAKASSKERNAGLEGTELQIAQKIGKFNSPGYKGRKDSVPMENIHPTVKPLSLMRYIIKLLAPPNDPILLDPFCGSGSTLIAAKQLGIRHIGIELNKEYCDIAEKRLEHWQEQ
jgi:16S rRNA G966 N2-methylase RsmD